MFIKHLVAICTLMGWGFTSALGGDNECVNLIKAASAPETGYTIYYSDGSTQNFPTNTTITLSSSGNYQLCSDVTVVINVPYESAPAVEIQASNVELDLAEFTIFGAVTLPVMAASYGIEIDGSHVTIKNGRIAGFTIGVYIDPTAAIDDIAMKDIACLDCEYGFGLSNETASISNVSFDGCAASNCTYGFDLNGSVFFVNNCVATNNGTGFLIYDSRFGGSATDIILQQCTAISNDGDGFSNNSSSCVLLGNFAYKNGTNYAGNSSNAYISIDNGAQLPPGIKINRSIDNIEII